MKYSIHWSKNAYGEDVDYVSWSTCGPECCKGATTERLNVVFDQLRYLTVFFPKCQVEVVVIK